MPYVFLVEHAGNKWKLEVETSFTPLSEFLSIVKTKCEIKDDVNVEFFDKDFEEWVSLDASQYNKLPDKSKLRVVQPKAVVSNVASPKPSDEPILPKYDIFVSHKQTTGKYLAQSIKHELSQCFPVPLSWWIDVDNLENLQDLTEVVRLSRNFMLLITPGLFDSHWCLQEIRAAIKYKKNVILILDEGVPFPVVQTLPADIQELFKGTLAITYHNQKHHRDVAIQEIAAKIKTTVLLPGEKIQYEDPEIAHGKPVLISGIFGNAIQFKGSNIVDGNENTRWSGSPTGKDCWAVIDLGQRYTFSGLEIKFEYAFGKKFLIEVEKEEKENIVTEWTAIADCRGQEGWCYYNLRDAQVPPVGRHLRIHLQEGREPTWGFSIWLVKLFGKPVD